MDSLTQAVLGATVGYAVGGPALGRKAALWGIGLGTLPDLDVLIPKADPVIAFVEHRGFSHSLVLLTALSPLFAKLIGTIHRTSIEKSEQGTSFWRLVLMVWLIFVTHVLLDSLTSYGTQIFWPLTAERWPVALASISIIDPLYTLPLLIATLWVLIRGRERPDGRKTLAAPVTITALTLSTLYLAWGLSAQSWLTNRAKQQLVSQQISTEKLIVTPTMGNSLLWYVLTIDGDKAHYGWMSVLDDDETPLVLKTIDRKLRLSDKLDHDPRVKSLAHFSGGFFALDEREGRLVYTDLRMGLAPSFAFNFVLAENGGQEGRFNSLKPAIHLRDRFDLDSAWSFLRNRIADAGLTR